MAKKRKTKKKKYVGTIKITDRPVGFVVIPRSISVKGRGATQGEDIIVFEENLNCALDKDEVEIEIIGKDRDRKKGKVTKIIKRNKTNFVGTLEKSGNGLSFVPDDWKFYRKVDILNFPKEAKAGLKVLVKIENWTNPNLNPKGQIVTIIGPKGVHETEMQSILLDKGIVYDFPAQVEKEATNLKKKFSSESVQVFSQNLSKLSLKNFPRGNKRLDFRNAITFTIDPKDAKDFDDALSYEEIGDGKIRVGIHIADVSHFVSPGSALDREASERNFSTYLVDRTIPMLPEVLSNDICSLMPNADRYTFSAVFDIKKKTGEVLDRWFGKTIINSNRRFSYEEAQEILNTTKDSSSSLNFVVPLQELNRIAEIYRKEKSKNDAIEFEADEIKFELDARGKPLRIYKEPRLDTMKMIEEWMLLANREVAKFISDKIKKRGGASIFRVHDLPDMEKIEELSVFVKALGYKLPISGKGVRAKDLNFLFSQIEGHIGESLVKTAVIRSMAKAEYSTRNIGHFGLAFKYYTHFTSPIRRYPDLVVHRILNRYLKGEPIPKNEIAKLKKIAEKASEKEIIIQTAERDSVKYKQVEFMQDKIGEEFEVVVSGVTEWGVYVEDPETKAEGLVRIKSLTDDHYRLNSKNYCIIGEHTKNKLALGDIVKVKLISADLDRKTLDFELV